MSNHLFLKDKENNENLKEHLCLTEQQEKEAEPQISSFVSEDGRLIE